MPGNYNPDEKIIDGSFYRSNIHSTAPLLKLSGSHHKVVYTKGSSVPVWIETKTENAAASRLSTVATDIKGQCISYLNSISHLTKITNPSEEVEIVSIQNSDGTIHVKLNQKYKGVKIEGSEFFIHINKNGKVLNGRFLPSPSMNTIESIVSNDNAVMAVVSDLKKDGVFRDLTDFENQLLDYSGPSSELILYREDLNSSKLTLAWKVEARPNPLDHYEYIINALNGNIIDKSNHTCNTGVSSTATDLNGNTKTFNTYQSGATFYMIDISKPMYSSALSSLPDNPVGAIWTIDANNTDLTTFQQITSGSANSWSAKAVSAHTNSDSTFKYYKNVHLRNSIDSMGGTIISVINVTSGGQGMDNAYWNGKFMAYGSGNVLFKPLAGGLDVAAHEMTHGVIQKTANLTYKGQSGAINESMADIFGCMVDRDDWKIGEDVMASGSAPYFPSGALRDLSDPHNGGTSSSNASWQPNHMNEFVFTSSDNGGVHVNSGIPNYAFYLFSTAVSKSVSEKVYYNALKNYLTASSQFIDLRLAVVQSSIDLYPGNSSIADAAKSAFDQVGITDGSSTSVSNDLPVNPGTDYILLNGTYQLNFTLVNATPDGNTLTGISHTPIANRVSVTDNGSTSYFVDDLGNIIKMDMSDNSETVFDNSKFWANVAVSKDGLRLAAVTEDIDSSIYIRQTSGGGWTRFMLYNPTFTTGITTSGPQYADALDWDHTGGKLMFDCYNLTVSNTNDTIDYWSIGIMDVWDNAGNTFGDGSIRNLFDGLPSYVSIGNPTFSKNSPNIVAFDYFDGSDYSITIVGTNTETGDAKYIIDFDLGMLGYPSYSKNDDKVAFTTFDNNYDTSVFCIGLNSDKISYSDYNSIVNIFYGKMPVWYATGSRILSSNQNKTSVLSGMKAYPNPLIDEINLDLNLLNEGEVNIEILNLLGQPIKTLFKGNENSGEHSYTFSVSELQSGTYILKATTVDGYGIVKMIKTK